MTTFGAHQMAAPTRVTLEDLKLSILRQVSSLPTRPSTIASILDRPLWQVEAAIASLTKAGLVITFRGFIRRTRASLL